MCQRVLIAFAFASHPKLVIADEPTTALDVTIQARIVRLIAEMQERDGTAVVFITHDLRLAAQVCDDILVLYAGRAVEYGPARKVFLRRRAIPTRAACSLRTTPMRAADRAARSWRCPSACRACALTRASPAAPSRRVVRTRVTDCRAAHRRQLLPPTIGAWTHVAACIRADVNRRRSRSPRSSRRPSVMSGVATARAILEVEHLTKQFVSGGLFRRKAFTAVNDVSFMLRENEFVGIVGESGSGKSTIARLIVGLEMPTSRAASRLAGVDVMAGRSRLRRASPPPRADGVPGPAVGAQPAPPRRQHRDAAAQGRAADPTRAGNSASNVPVCCCARSACRRMPQCASRPSSPAASASASTSRARSARCRASSSPTRSCPGWTSRCRRNS